MTGGPRILLRGGGDLATGVAARLHRTGFQVVVCEIEQPLAVRRLVALAEAVYAGQVQIEDLPAVKVANAGAVVEAWAKSQIPVLVDPAAASRQALNPDGLVDGRMRKQPPELGREAAPMVIGLGPGFTAGKDCHAVVETMRGHHLGRVIWAGQAQADTGVPDPVGGKDRDRVLRAPATGVLTAVAEIGQAVEQGAALATVDGHRLEAPFNGVLRGIIHDGVAVKAGMKVGDLDPRLESGYASQISDKALAVGGGVLEALLTRPQIRAKLAD
jgi:xanthine dehydrogenase accessory factor